MITNDQTQTTSSKSMVDSFKSIFTTKNNVPNNHPQPSAKNGGETYRTWGVRWAGSVTGNIAALSPALQSCYTQNINEQNANLELQQSNQRKIQSEIENKKGQKDSENIQLQARHYEKKKIEDSIIEYRNKIDDIKSGDRTNIMSKVNFYIGGIITFLLALYLFIFYSSASFSAFFGNSNVINAGAAILDPQCFTKAMTNGLGQLMFILLMPVIFLGLGFLIHQFGESEKGAAKYIKIGWLYFVTFIFDALLAFHISETVYTNTVLSPEQYTVSMAFNSPSFWIVIFSGFVAYVIWGLVFDFTLQHFDNMNEHTKEIRVLEDKISHAKNKTIEIDRECSEIQRKINNLDTEINRLKTRLQSGQLVDTNVLKKALSDFFNGWISYMAQLAVSQEEKDQASSIYDKFISQIQ